MVEKESDLKKIVSRVIQENEELLENPKNLFRDDGSYKTFSVTSNQYPKIVFS